jgi:hypothetical protein
VDPQRNEVNAIRHRMVQIRRKHHEDVRGLIAGAEAVAGWGRHIAQYSGAALGAATVAALWLAARPGRPDTTRTIPSTSNTTTTAVTEGLVADTDRSKPRAKWLGGAWKFMLSVAVRAAQSYAAYQVDQWIIKQRESMAAKLAPHAPASGAEPPNRRRDGPERDAHDVETGPIEMDLRRFPR